MPGRKEYRGAAGQLTLAAGISNSDTSINVDGPTTGFPTGTLYPFVVRIDGGNAGEEKVLCSSLSGSVLTVTQRGYDDTTASAHSLGVSIEHCNDADSFDTFAAHAFDDTRDDHSQYMPINGSRPFTDVSGLTGNPISVGTANAAGTSENLARADHEHDIADGAIDHSALFAAGVVDSAAIATDAVGTAEIAADAVTASEIAAGAVGASEIADASITPTEMAVGALGGILSQPVTGGPAGGTAVTLATISIPAQPYAYTLDVSAFWSGQNSDDNDTFSLTVKVDGVAKGKAQNRHTGGANSDMNYSVPCITPVAIAATTACTVTVVAIREVGVGNISQSQAGVATAKIYPYAPAP